jgi:hypothetical protein
MNQLSMRRMTGAFGLASVGIWLALFPLYTVQPPASLHDGAATAQALYTIRIVGRTSARPHSGQLLGANS